MQYIIPNFNAQFIFWNKCFRIVLWKHDSRSKFFWRDNSSIGCYKYTAPVGSTWILRAFSIGSIDWILVDCKFDLLHSFIKESSPVMVENCQVHLWNWDCCMILMQIVEIFEFIIRNLNIKIKFHLYASGYTKNI